MMKQNARSALLHMIAVMFCSVACCALACCSSAVGQSTDPNEEYVYDGFLEAGHDVFVSAIEIGRLQAVHIKVGDRVEAGQEIALLENDAQLIAVEIAKSQVEMSGEIEAATAERELSISRAEQLRMLATMGTARPDEVARAETDLVVAVARLKIAVEQQQSRVLELRRQEVQLERRRVLSPIAGIVAKVIHQPGEYVSPGDAAIARIIAKDVIYANITLPANDALGLTVNQVVPVKPSTSMRPVNGVVDSISPAIDGESGTVAVRIRIDNRDEILIPGDRCSLLNVRTLPSSVQSTKPRTNQATHRTQTLRMFSR